MIGRTVSRYRILDKLGEGGMGEVYLAEDPELRRNVAIKFLPSDFVSDPEALARFRREAQAAAALDHPNIVTVYEVGDHDGRPFIVMACVRGQTLGEAIAGGDLSMDRALDIAIEACDGLGCAHAADVVHRDVKPGNILIGEDGRAKLLDFGLAKLKGVNRLTKEDSTVGTVYYMSPEQARGQDVDHRSDIFSLGVVLYEMITGHLPFHGDHQAAVLYSITSEDPQPLRRFNREVSEELERIVDKALAKDPSKRYQHAGDLLVDLRALRSAATTGRVAKGTARSRSRLLPLIALAGVILVAIAVAVGLRISGPPATPVETAPADDRKMIAVLPFKNMGPPELEYFADGVTDEITSRLAALSGLGVISRTSAFQYKAAGKSVKQIGVELGVDYVIEGAVRWDGSGGEGNRVRVSTQLIRVADDTHMWSQVYDRVIADIFAVQSDIAGRITEQLGISVVDSERQAVEAAPTGNLLAYETYLRGLNRMHGAGRREEEWRKAENLFQQAVDLDSTFALAHAKLAIVHGEMYFWGFDRTDERLASARAAAERALEIQPDLPQAHQALGGYYYMGFFDYDRALREYAVAAATMPNNPEVLQAIGYVWRRQGLFEEARSYLEKATILDPRHFWYELQLGITCTYLSQYEEADRRFDRSADLGPDNLSTYVHKCINILCWTGDLSRSRTALESSPSRADPESRIAMFWQNLYERDYQAARDQLAGLPDIIVYLSLSTVLRDQLAGHTYQLQGDLERARSFFQSALVIAEATVREQPGDGRAHGALGLVYAGLDRRAEALREGRRAMELQSNDALSLPLREWEMVQILLTFDEQDAALDHIDHLLSVPSAISVRFLELTPETDPIRDHPRFARIMEAHATDGP